MISFGSRWASLPQAQMELDFDDDQDALRDTVRDVLERECPIALVRSIVEAAHEGADDPGAAAQALWKTMVSLDWPALTMPEDVGGIGLGFIELAVVAEELGRVVAPGPFLPTVTQFAPVVREAGTPEQRERFLGAVARGERTGTLALADHDRGWSVEEIEMVARPDGDGWRLDGTKRFVMEAGAADDLVVAARLEGSEGADGIVAAVVPRTEVTVEPITSLDASRRYAAVVLDDVPVPADRVLGTAGDAGRPLARALEEATVALATEAVGCCQTIFDTTLEYAKQREQFGVAIGSFQAVKHKLVDMYVALERARSLAYYAAACIAEGHDERTLAASMAKAAAGDCQRLVARDGIQLHGGIGFTWEADLHLYVKRAMSAESILGSTTDHRARVASLG